MKKYIIFILFGIVVFCTSAIINKLKEPVSSIVAELPETVDFNFHIKPILSDRCLKCHGPDENARKGNLRLDQASGAFKKVSSPDALASHILRPGNKRKSEVYHRINSGDEAYMMPPPESNLELSIYEKALIEKWIEQGAVYKTHWSFSSPEMPKVPKIDDNWANNEIDRFIHDKMKGTGLRPSPRAEKTTLLRRATLDLTGLPPDPEEIEAFISDDSNDAYDKLIDRLMASPQYGERMALEWLDVARYADSHGYQDDGMRTTWPWRDWVIEAYNENLPYDEFVIWQLAGDLLDDPTREQLLATCFNRNHPQSQEGGVVDEEYRVEYVADRTNTFGKAFMGLTMECARCHDHKYDPVSQKDYYSLYAFFNNNNESGIVPYNGEASPTVFLPSERAEQQLDSLGRIIDSLSAGLVTEQYKSDFEDWYQNLVREIEVKNDYGLVADFSFDEEVEASLNAMNLNRQERDKLPKKDQMVKAFINQAKQKADATIWGDKDRRPKLTDGIKGKGVAFLGDAGLRFNRDLDLDRHQAFSVSLWVKPFRDSLEGPIFNNSNGAFEGYRGWLCKLNLDGTLSFQFNHVWPDNAIDIKTLHPLPVNQWSHIGMTYDGSSQAKGIRIFIDGKTPPFTVLADKLYKSLLHGKNNSNWSSMPFILGIEMTKSIEDLAMDELKIYKRQLSDQEIASMSKQQTKFKKSDYSKEELTDHYLVSGYNEKYNEKRRLITLARAEENRIATDEMEVMIMHERREERPTYILDRGMYDRPVIRVEPAIPGIFADKSDKPLESRLDLAKWLVSDNHPLTARVAVNRIWKMLFGRGIVNTQEDFGSQGSLPTHPELIDWLALKLIDLDWDQKALIKCIMTSAVYTQSSVATEEAKLKDPGNLYYSHFPAYRLSAEIIRDHALASSGLLVKKIGGPSVYPYQPKGLWKALATRNATEYKQDEGDNLYRRSMYTIWKRSSPPPSMMTFDAPDRYYCVVNRQKTATPLQALILMNDPQFLEASRVLALKMQNQKHHSPVEFAFMTLLGRKPNAVELSILIEQREKALEVLKDNPENVNAWISMGDFQLDYEIDKTEWAANTMVASTIMNMDEFVMKR